MAQRFVVLRYDTSPRLEVWEREGEVWERTCMFHPAALPRTGAGQLHLGFQVLDETHILLGSAGAFFAGEDYSLSQSWLSYLTYDPAMRTLTQSAYFALNDLGTSNAYGTAGTRTIDFPLNFQYGPRRGCMTGDGKWFLTTGRHAPSAYGASDGEWNYDVYALDWNAPSVTLTSRTRFYTGNGLFQLQNGMPMGDSSVFIINNYFPSDSVMQRVDIADDGSITQSGFIAPPVVLNASGVADCAVKIDDTRVALVDEDYPYSPAAKHVGIRILDVTTMTVGELATQEIGYQINWGNYWLGEVQGGFMLTGLVDRHSDYDIDDVHIFVAPVAIDGLTAEIRSPQSVSAALRAYEYDASVTFVHPAAVVMEPIDYYSSNDYDLMVIQPVDRDGPTTDPVTVAEFGLYGLEDFGVMAAEKVLLFRSGSVRVHFAGI